MGLRADQALGHLATGLLAHDPDLRHESQHLRRALAGEVTHTLSRLPSRSMSLETWYIPVKDALGKVTEVVGVSLDVTERLETQRRIERANEDLRRSNAELEQFAYVVSHDLQEPLRTVTSFLQLLTSRYEGQLDANARLYVRMIQEGNERMARLLNDLLVFSRASAAQPSAQVDVGAVLTQVVQDLHAQIERTGADVCLGEVPAVWGDATQLRQVFQNLIGNALKFGAPGRPPRIQVRARPDGASVQFSVADNGVGIEAQFFGRIFTIFQRLHTRDQYEGNGIGLSLVRKIVERHGGKVWLDSVPAQGTTFFLTLPSSPPEDASP